MAFYKPNTQSEPKTGNLFWIIIAAIMFFGFLWGVSEWIGFTEITYGLD